MRFVEAKEMLPALITEEACTDLVVVEEKPIQLKFIAAIPHKVSGVKKPVDSGSLGKHINVYV
jgi:hypothetical protein